MKRLINFLVLITIFVLAVGQSSAQLQWDEEGVPIRKSLHINHQGWTVKSPSGDMYVVWSDTRENAPKIFGQKYDSDGNSIWGEDKLLQETYPWMMVVVPTSDNGLALIWAGPEYYNPTLWAQKIDSDGNVLWGPDGVYIGTFLWEPGDSDSTDGSYSYFNAEQDASGGIFVTWLLETASNHLTLFGKRLLTDGSLAPGWDEEGSILKDDIMYQGNDHQKYIAHDGNNGLIYSWQIYVAGDKYNYAQKVDSECNLQWGDDGILLSENGTYYRLPASVMDGEGGAFIVWTDDRSGETDLYMQRIDADGNILWGTHGYPLITAPNSQLDQTLEYDGENGFFAAWENYVDAFESDLSCQHVSGNGELLWGTFGILLCTAEDEQHYVQIDADGEGGIFAIWSDWRDYGYSQKDCYMQHVDSDGNISWQYNGIMLSGGDDNSVYSFTIAGTDDGGALCPYYEGGLDLDMLKMQKVDANGRLQFPAGEIIVETIHGGMNEYQLAAMENERYLAAWTDLRHMNTSERKIYYQIIDNDGNVLLEENGLPICGGYFGKQDNCAITGTTDGGAVITWWEWRGTVNSMIYAQKIDSEGNILWNWDGVRVDFREVFQYYQFTCPDDNGGAYVMWRGYVGNYPWGYDEIIVQRLDAEGNRLFGDIAIPVTNDPFEDKIRGLVADGEGGAICVFSRDNDGDIFALRVLPNGTTAWMDSVVYGQQSSANDAVVIPRHGGGAIVAWEDSRNGLGIDVYAQKFDINGRMLWADNGIPVVALHDNQLNPNMAEDENGYTYVLWRQYERDYDIFCQRLNPAGERMFADEGIVVCVEDYIQSDYGMVPDGNGGVLISWMDCRNLLTEYQSDIYGTHLDSQGQIANPIWGQNGNPICEYIGGQYDALMVSDGYGGGVMIWDDHRCMSGNDLFAQRVNDYIVGVDDPSLSSLPDDYKLYQNYPNPFNNSTCIGYYLPAISDVELVVFDITGREAVMLVDGRISAGYHTAEWDAGNMSSGIYFVRMKAGDRVKVLKSILLK